MSRQTWILTSSLLVLQVSLLIAYLSKAVAEPILHLLPVAVALLGVFIAVVAARSEK
jgi:hypothetical protein